MVHTAVVFRSPLQRVFLRNCGLEIATSLTDYVPSLISKSRYSTDVDEMQSQSYMYREVCVQEINISTSNTIWSSEIMKLKILQSIKCLRH